MMHDDYFVLGSKEKTLSLFNAMKRTLRGRQCAEELVPSQSVPTYVDSFDT